MPNGVLHTYSKPQAAAWDPKAAVPLRRSKVMLQMSFLMLGPEDPTLRRHLAGRCFMIFRTTCCGPRGVLKVRSWKLEVFCFFSRRLLGWSEARPTVAFDILIFYLKG